MSSISGKSITAVILYVLVSGAVISPGAATYYVSSVNGSDSAAGTRQSAPWRSLAKVNATTFQPADTILFMSGLAWSGQFYPRGSGMPGMPIVVDIYGGTAKPKINGNGMFEDAVKLENQSFWELNNLEVTNTGTSPALRSGIRIWSVDAGTVRHVLINGMYVHDVNSLAEGKRCGGIGIEAAGSMTPSKFDSVFIENCVIRKVRRAGIWTYSTWRIRGGTTDGSGPWFPSTNLVIKNNVIDSAGGDGIVVRVCRAPLVERNVVKHAASIDKEYVAGLWPFNCDDALFQYNEACSTHTTSDGQGFDCDWMSRRTVFQYNYSHDNEGGFMLVCCDGGKAGNFNDSSIVRFNLSVNDGVKVFKIAGTPTNTLICNNTVYTRYGSIGTLINVEQWNGLAGKTSFVNNIFMMDGTYSLNVVGSGMLFDRNIWYGIVPPVTDRAPITATPLLAGPGSSPMGIGNLQGYKITLASPARASGTAVLNPGAFDFWGTPLRTDTLDRGAHQLSSELQVGVPNQRKAVKPHLKKSPSRSKRPQGVLRASPSIIYNGRRITGEHGNRFLP